MSKVISFKVSDNTYVRLKSLNKTFKEIVEPLVLNYLNSFNEKEYTPRIRKETRDKYKEACEYIDTFLKLDSGGF
jgi:hypothetical protein